MLPKVLSVCLLAVGVSAIPTSFTDGLNHVIHEKRDVVPRHWQKRSRVDPTAVLPVRIGLTQSNLDRGDSLLHDVSTPFSPKYGQHLSAEEVRELFAPKQDSVEAVREWLHTTGK